MLRPRLKSAVKRCLQSLQRLRTPAVPDDRLLVSRQFGLDRGQPIDRYYIESFLSENAGRITGSVLEIGDAIYTHRFGSRIASSEVLHLTERVGPGGIVGDLQDPRTLAGRRYDCIILTQVLQFIPRPDEALSNAWAACAEGGTMLLTVPCITQISEFDEARWGEYWRFTERGVRLMLGRLEHAKATVRSRGNLTACVAFLRGLCVQDLPDGELDSDDPRYPCIVTARVEKQSQIDEPSR